MLFLSFSLQKKDNHQFAHLLPPTYLMWSLHVFVCHAVLRYSGSTKLKNNPFLFDEQCSLNNKHVLYIVYNVDIVDLLVSNICYFAHKKCKQGLAFQLASQSLYPCISAALIDNGLVGRSRWIQRKQGRIHGWTVACDWAGDLFVRDRRSMVLKVWGARKIPAVTGISHSTFIFIFVITIM